MVPSSKLPLLVAGLLFALAPLGGCKRPPSADAAASESGTSPLDPVTPRTVDGESASPLGAPGETGQARTLGAFTAIDNDGFATVVVTVGAAPALSVRCSDGDPSWVTTSVVDGELRVRTKPVFSTAPAHGDGKTTIVVNGGTVTVEGSNVTVVGGDGATTRVDARPAPRCDVDVAAPRLVRVRDAGAGDLTVRGSVAGLASVEVHGAGSVAVDLAAAPSVRLATHGAGKLRVGRVAARETTVAVSGAGSATVAGRTDAVRIDASGSGHVHATGLRADEGTLVSSGAGAIDAHVTTRVDAKAGGAGRVRVHGNPAARTIGEAGAGAVEIL